jgi:hypothetical protein
MTLLAHAGGADEMLLVLVPFIVFLAVYRLVRGPLPPESQVPTRERSR